MLILVFGLIFSGLAWAQAPSGQTVVEAPRPGLEDVPLPSSRDLEPMVEKQVAMVQQEHALCVVLAVSVLAVANATFHGYNPLAFSRPFV